MHSEIGLALKLARVATGLTQWDLALATGIHPGVILEIEHGRRAPSPELATRMLAEFQARAPHYPLVDLILTQAANATTGELRK